MHPSSKPPGLQEASRRGRAALVLAAAGAVLVIAVAALAFRGRQERVYRTVAQRLQAPAELAIGQPPPLPLDAGFPSSPEAADPRSTAAAGSIPSLAPFDPKTRSGPAPAQSNRPAVREETRRWAPGGAPEVPPPTMEFNRIAPSPPPPPFTAEGIDPALDSSSDSPVSASTPRSTASPSLAGYVGGPAAGTEENIPPGEASGEPAGPQDGTRPPMREPPPESKGPARITLVPLGDAVTGQNVRVAARIDSAVDVSSTPFNLEFNGRVLRFVRVLAGDFLSRSGVAPLILAAPIGDEGEVTVGISLPGVGSGVSGSGTLLVLEFLGLAPGTSPLQFVQPSVLNSRRREIPADFIPATVVVR